MAIPPQHGKLPIFGLKDSTLQLLRAEDLREIFSSNKKHELGVPKLEHVDWGILDYFGWVHPSGHRGFVIMPVQGELHGLKLRRMLNHSARPRTHMCSWCHHVYRSRGTALFSTIVAGSDGRRTIGNYICTHLDCSVRIRNLTSDPPTYLPETMELRHKIWRLQTAITSFMARANLLADTL